MTSTSAPPVCEAEPRPISDLAVVVNTELTEHYIRILELVQTGLNGVAAAQYALCQTRLYPGRGIPGSQIKIKSETLPL